MAIPDLTIDLQLGQTREAVAFEKQERFRRSQMSEKWKVVRIFIGSPGGLQEERSTARDVVEEINLSHADHWGLRLHLVGWEDTIPGYHRPQSKINEDLDRCDYFLGVLWDRWGSRPTPDQGEYESGFEEEFYRAENNIKQGKMKDLTVFFKEVIIPKGLEPGSEIKKVLHFKERCITEKKVFFKEFSALDGFRSLVRAKLTDIGWAETELKKEAAGLLPQSEHVPEPGEVGETGNKMLDSDARKFLADFSTKPSDWASTDPGEIARFRLIATAVGRSGNDDLYLGNHDANLLFKERDQFNFSDQEIRALIDCGVVGYTGQNVPLWHWMIRAGSGRLSFERIEFLVAVGNDKEVKNSLQILEAAERGIPDLDGYFNRKRLFAEWFAQGANQSVAEAAISFVARNGRTEDADELEEAKLTASPKIALQIEAALVEITSRHDVVRALGRLLSSGAEKLSDEVVQAIFCRPSTLETGLLEKALDSKIDGVRARSAEILESRSALDIEQATHLLTDSNFDVRVVAAEALKRLGQPLNDEQLTKALVIESSGGLLGSKEPNKKYFDRYSFNRLSELEFGEVRDLANKAGILNSLEISVLFGKHGSKLVEEIRNDLADGYRSFLLNQIRNDPLLKGMDGDVTTKFVALSDFRRRHYCSMGLDALCDVSDQSDLPLVRKAIDSESVDGSTKVLAYLGRFGDWSDVERIKGLGEHPEEQSVFLAMGSVKLPRQKAQALIDVGSERIADVFNLDIPNRIRLFIPSLLSNRAVSECADEVLLRELNREHDTYRIMMAAKCVVALTKGRLQSLLMNYVNSDSNRYYNSIHWLDLGASAPRAVAKRVAGRTLFKLERQA